MTTLALIAAECGPVDDPTPWPAVVVLVAFMALVGFIGWAAAR